MGRTIALLIAAGAALAVFAVPVAKREFRTRMEEIVRTAVRAELSDDALLLWRQRQRIATAETALFVNEKLAAVKMFEDRFQLLDYALTQVAPELADKGLYCEFGVWKGESINHIAQKLKGRVHGFDSFEGLPEDWITQREKGTFAVEKLPPVRPNVSLYKGWFSDSLPKFTKDHPGPLAFGHLDADLYSSTRDVFRAMDERVVPGTILVFDEYFNYPGWRDGEFKALEEYGKQVEFQYIGYVNGGQQAAVKITKRR